MESTDFYVDISIQHQSTKKHDKEAKSEKPQIKSRTVSKGSR